MNLKLFIILFSVLLLHLKSTGQNLMLYNEQGRADAYIDTEDEDLTIYLLNGKATAYLSLRDSIYDVYGFNGLHLGWFSNGILRDKEGFMVGCAEGACYVITMGEPFGLPFKQLKPFKSFKDLPPFQPLFYDLFSKQTLTDFLINGIR